VPSGQGFQHAEHRGCNRRMMPGVADTAHAVEILEKTARNGQARTAAASGVHRRRRSRRSVQIGGPHPAASRSSGKHSGANSMFPRSCTPGNRRRPVHPCAPFTRDRQSSEGMACSGSSSLKPANPPDRPSRSYVEVHLIAVEAPPGGTGFQLPRPDGDMRHLPRSNSLRSL